MYNFKLFLPLYILSVHAGSRQFPKIHYSGGSRISRRGGVDLVGGGVDSQGGYVLLNLYVKTKELGPLGGAHAGCAP